jgi:hypothetical protein
MDETTLKYLFRDKLENYETPVEPADWDIIHRRLQQQRQRRTGILWLATGAAAATVALFFMLYHPSVVERSPVVEIVADAFPLSIAVPDEVWQPAPVQANNRTAAPHKTAVPLPEQSFLETARHEIPATTTIPADTAQTANAVPQIAANVTPEKAETTIAQGKQDSLFTFPLVEEFAQQKQPEKKNLELALLAGQSGGISAANNFGLIDKSLEYAVSSADGLSEAYTNARNEMMNNATKTIHHIPLSFGLTFRFYFTSHWAVESGVVYTYLSSEYQYGNDYRIKQQLHYLGLPVNIVYQFFDSKRFSMYLSGGGMFEKGISANYAIITPDSRIDNRGNIAAWQWSLNGQLGGSYHFSKHFSLYVEPGVRYFFPDVRQPESVRTERPFNFNLGFGIRIRQ